jgi:glycosyltransferase involved in cell wall biosynthesis
MGKSKTQVPSEWKATIITITQFKRKDWLDLLFRCIKNQTGLAYINDWIIVDGSKDDEDQDKLRDYLEYLNQTYQLPVSYFSTKHNKQRCLGWLRNFAHEKLKENTTHIIVCDDDDYNFPTRVYETLKLFQKKKCNLIGTNSQYLYHNDTNTLFKFKDGVFGENHSVNSCLAYSVEYVKHNKYDDSKVRSEEPSFLNNFKNKMEQLDANHSIIGMSYSAGNTFNKNMINLQNILMRDTPNTSATIIPNNLSFFMGKKMAKEYLSLMRPFDPEVQTEYQITYYTGLFCPPWEFDKKDLGGSESACVQLSTKWAKLGYSVEVYGLFPSLEFEDGYKEYNGVHYYHVNKFSFSKTYLNLILWRLSGLVILDENLPLKANHIYADLHDHSLEQISLIHRHQDRIEKVFFKSQFHSAIADHEFPFFKSFSAEKRLFIQNGLEKETFTKDYGVQRDKYRLQYSSSYFRGLKDILKVWKIIHQAEPRAELHVYYGMDLYPNEQERDEIRALLAQEGVMDHGRQSKEVVAREKQRAGFHLYTTNTTSEICCISIKESMASGCIPILSNVNIFSMFAGVHIKWDQGQSVEDYYTRVAFSVIDILRMPDEEFNHLTEEMKKSELIKSWGEVSLLWLDPLNLAKPYCEYETLVAKGVLP